jgi:hypothetical protein
MAKMNGNNASFKNVKVSDSSSPGNSMHKKSMPIFFYFQLSS